jgi:hypothetical protein
MYQTRAIGMLSQHSTTELLDYIPSSTKFLKISEQGWDVVTHTCNSSDMEA